MDGAGLSRQLSSSEHASGHYLLLDHACGSCVACAAGSPVWCAQPRAGQPLCSVPEDLDATAAVGLLSALSAFLTAEVAIKSVVLAVAAKGQESIGDLLGIVHLGPVLVASDSKDATVKYQLKELSEVGRADVVVSLLSGRDGVLAVKRGGILCLGGACDDMPSVTELAQREVRVVGPRDNSEFVKKVGREMFETVLERNSKTSLPLR